MDVEKIQRINQLAVDLMKQGLATDREEAIRQAERLVARDDYSSLNDTIKNVEADARMESKGGEEDLSQEKIKEILEKNTAFFVKKIKEFQEQLKSLQDEMAALRRNVAERSINSRPPNMEMKENQETKEAKADRTQKQEMSAKGASHPRSGNYADSDVSIEKFFYCGSK